VKLSVVIPALDEAERIEAAIRGALEAPPDPAVELIVVDGGSCDATRALAAAAGARVLETGRGRARQLRAGVSASAGDVLLFLHADTRLPRGWAAAVRDALRDERVVAGAFRLRFDEPAFVFRFIEFGARVRSAFWRLPYGDQALFVRRSALEAVGGIPDVPIMEDLDLVYRLKRRGRLALLGAPAVTSARRYRAGGPLRTMLRHWLAAAAWTLGVDRERVAHWVGR
jgi:rSAM/selenodomain-associated transferase 2